MDTTMYRCPSCGKLKHDGECGPTYEEVEEQLRLCNVDNGLAETALDAVRQHFEAIERNTEGDLSELNRGQLIFKLEVIAQMARAALDGERSGE